LECLCLGWHEESGVFTNLAELRVSKTVLDDAVDETKSNWMVLHFGVVKIVEQESRYFFNHDCVVSAVKWRSCLQCDLMLDSRSRKEVASYEHELEEDLLELLGVGVDDLVLLESFKGTERAPRDITPLVFAQSFSSRSSWFLFLSGGLTFDEVNPVGVDDTVVSAPNSEVVCDEDDRSFNWSGYPGLSWAVETSSPSTASTASVTPALASIVSMILIVSVVSALHCNLMKMIR
jgi:hypothetical protein